MEHPVSHTDLPVLVLVRPVVDANTEFVHVGHTIAAIALVELQQLSVQCNIHGTIGTKKTIVWKEWTKKKNGLFGFVRKHKTEYECHFSWGASTNSGHQEIVSRFLWGC